MFEWLLSPIDPTASHDVGMALAWHGRSMVLAWGILAPLAVVAARYFKVMPGQDWPRELDNQTWWRGHWMGQMVVLLLSGIGLGLVLPLQWSDPSTHGLLGATVLAGLVVQIALGLLRGSKGGPTAPAEDGSLTGDHYDMTPRRRWFEALHKTIGYGALILGGITILYGLVHANGPNWMWVVLVLWWLALGALCVILQNKGMAVPSYQAIWGDDPAHPGNGLIKPTQTDDRMDHIRDH